MEEPNKPGLIDLFIYLFIYLFPLQQSTGNYIPESRFIFLILRATVRFCVISYSPKCLHRSINIIPCRLLQWK